MLCAKGLGRGSYELQVTRDKLQGTSYKRGTENNKLNNKIDKMIVIDKRFNELVTCN